MHEKKTKLKNQRHLKITLRNLTISFLDKIKIYSLKLKVTSNRQSDNKIQDISTKNEIPIKISSKFFQ